MWNWIKKWGHEVSMLVLAVWAAIGTAGQAGFINFVANGIAAHPKISATVSTISVILARFRKQP